MVFYSFIVHRRLYEVVSWARRKRPWAVKPTYEVIYLQGWTPRSITFRTSRSFLERNVFFCSFFSWLRAETLALPTPLCFLILFSLLKSWFLGLWWSDFQNSKICMILFSWSFWLCQFFSLCNKHSWCYKPSEAVKPEAKSKAFSLEACSVLNFRCTEEKLT